MDRELRREIENMRNQRNSYSSDFDESDKAMGLLFRSFLSFALLICGIVFPKITETVIPDYFKEIPVYISTNMSMEEIKDFIDSMAN